MYAIINGNMNEKTRCYFKELPENYVVASSIDPKNSKTLWTIRIMFPLLWAITFVICEAINGFDFSFKFELLRTIIAPLVFVIAYFTMVVLHELIHGLFNKIFTREKLTFGFSTSSAYCGVPDIYVKRAPKMVIAIAPFVTFLIALVVPLILIKDPFYYMLVSIFLGLHVGGCSGDLLEFFILLFKYRGKKVLINDTGPVQTIYTSK